MLKYFIILIIIILYTFIKLKSKKPLESFGDTKLTLYNKKSKYQKIKVVKHKKNLCLYLDNLQQVCTNNEKYYHEYLVHYPAAFYKKKIKKVLILGGGDLMTLREVMKYKTIDQVDMLEIDSNVIDISIKYFKTNPYSNDDRVNIIIGDAFSNINMLNNSYYDLILFDITETGNKELPLISIDFYKKCKEKLKKNGIIVKNGFSAKSFIILNQLFKYLEVYRVVGYPFQIASDTINFKDNKLYKKKFKSVKLKVYNYKFQKNLLE